MSFPIELSGIHSGKRDLTGWCAVINLNEKLKGLLIRLKISQGTLPSINGLFDDVRAPPIPRQLINGTITIR